MKHWGDNREALEWALLHDAHSNASRSPPRRFKMHVLNILGVDEHKWKHHRGDGTSDFVIIDLTPKADGTRPAWLLNVVRSRLAEVLRCWLAARDQFFRALVKAVAMDGFSGYHTATTV